MRTLAGVCTFALLLAACAESGSSDKDKSVPLSNPPVQANAEVNVDETSKDAGTQLEDDCMPIGGQDTATVRFVSQGSHADARTDLTITFASNKMTGDAYKLDEDGNTPVRLKIDREIDAEALDAMRKLLADTCAARKPVTKDLHQAPGGYSAMLVTNAKGEALWVAYGAAAIEAPGVIASVSSEAWSALVDAWPTHE